MRTHVFTRVTGKMIKEREEGLNDFLMAISTLGIINEEKYREKDFTIGIMVTPMTENGSRVRSTATGCGKVTLETNI